MHFQTHATIFDYCERGADPSFWGEPLNAITNGGFILAALAGMVMIALRPATDRSAWHYFFVLNFIAIGVGSFLFHTIPNTQTVQLDTTPIGVFMLTYLIYALRRFAHASWFLTASGIAAFIGAMVVAFNIQCWDGHVGLLLDNVPPGAQARCLNGSLGYAPALLAMWIMAAWLGAKGHPSAPLVFAAGLTFIISLSFRSLDHRLCGEWIVMGHRLGTHFIWHLLNSLTLFLLLVAAIRYGGARPQLFPPRPRPTPPRYETS